MAARAREPPLRDDDFEQFQDYDDGQLDELESELGGGAVVAAQQQQLEAELLAEQEQERVLAPFKELQEGDELVHDTLGLATFVRIGGLDREDYGNNGKIYINYEKPKLSRGYQCKKKTETWSKWVKPNTLTTGDGKRSAAKGPSGAADFPPL